MHLLRSVLLYILGGIHKVKAEKYSNCDSWDKKTFQGRSQTGKKSQLKVRQQQDNKKCP